MSNPDMTITPELLAILVDDLRDFAADLRLTAKSPSIMLNDNAMLKNVADRADAWADRLKAGGAQYTTGSWERLRLSLEQGVK